MTASPLLVLGSHTWNTPDAKGRLFCSGDRQDKVFASAAGYTLCHILRCFAYQKLEAACCTWRATSSQSCAMPSGVWHAPEAGVWAHYRSAGAVHLVLEGSGHDSFCDIVQLVAVRFGRAMAYLRSFRQASRLLAPQHHA